MLYIIIEILFTVLGSVAAAYGYLRVLQAERYQSAVYVQRVNAKKETYIRDNIVWAIICAGVRIYLPVLLGMFIFVDATRTAIAGLATPALFAGVCALQCYLAYRAPVRNPLTLTARLLRVAGMLAGLVLILSILLRLLRLPAYIAFAGLPYLLWLAETVIEPYENRMAAVYIRQAQKKRMHFKRLKVVGIAGAFGKTSVKYILGELLSLKYKVLVPPASYNTAQGLARILQDRLTAEHQVFIAELGARREGDIKRLCRLVRPQYAILTGVNAKDTGLFESVESESGTFNELIEALPEEKGFAVFGSDQSYLDRLYGKCERPKQRVSVEEREDVCLSARNISLSPDGMRFTMVREDGAAMHCHTRLLGGFAVNNILLATAMALRMGIPFERVPEATENMLPIERHLELKDDLPYCAIDDRANEGLDGMYEAARVLSKMPGQRVLVMYSGCQNLDDAYALGTEIARSADTVLFVGERKGQRSMMKGMLKSGFERGGLLTAADEDEAAGMLEEILQPGDTVLFEGDTEKEE